MGNSLPALLIGWITREPVAGLFLVVTAVLIIASAVSHRPVKGAKFQAWIWRLIQSLAGGLLFLGMAGSFQFLLNSHNIEFNDIYGPFTKSGSLSHTEWAGWRSRYGRQVTQRDLVVSSTVRRDVVEAIQPANPSGRTLYRNVIVEELLTENLIMGFEGNLHMDMAHPEHPTDRFNAFTLTADYHYQIKNPLQEEVYAKFSFPLPDARLSRDMRVTLDEVEIPVLVKSDWLTWERMLQPGEQVDASIHYFVSGMDYFVFEVPEPRQVQDFKLTLAINSAASGLITEPEGAISMEVTDVGAGKILTWKIANAIAAPRMGTYMTQGWPYSPSHSLLVVLPYAARALLFFLALTALTLLIAGESIDLVHMALLAALFCVPFFILMSGLPVPGNTSPANWDLWQIRMLPLLALLPAGLGYLVLRETPPFPKLLIMALMVLFAGVYPLAGSIPDEQKRNAILGGVQAGMIFYIFAYTLYTRIRRALNA